MNLTNQQKYIVQGMLCSSDPAICSNENIAKELDIPLDVLNTYLAELENNLKKIEKGKKKKKDKPQPIPGFKDMLIKTTKGGAKGVTMMTEGASVRTDKANQKPVRQSDPLHPQVQPEHGEPTPLPKSTRGNIFRPETGKIE